MKNCTVKVFVLRGFSKNAIGQKYLALERYLFYVFPLLIYDTIRSF